ncbi:MAG TPA: patatin-like phospholipase family protein [Vicinamibacterales bacterium]|jgi:hypothetical protein|nr:patatin-like phospholipase family protein [Vicinamibacterales bacterium]
MERGIASSADPYSPQRRTALVLTGVGTAGAYHAGVLRALHEAGVKIDIVAARGVGVIGALFAAVDGGARLWDDKGFWRSRAVRRFYSWRLTLRLIVAALVVSSALVLIPIAAVAAGFVVFPIDFVLKLVGIEVAGGLVAWYVGVAQAAFAPTGLPTWLPRLVLIVLGLTTFIVLAAGWSNRDERKRQGPFWWRAVRAPLSADHLVQHCWSTMWDLVRGAAPLGQPAPPELARRYAEMLAENIGQPGFRELLIAVHDIDARRDLIFALVGTERRRDLLRRWTTDQADARPAEVQDLGGVAVGHLTDAVAASLAIPLVTEFHAITFSPDAFWRGETHRIADRPSELLRLIEELVRLDVEQIILVSAAAEAPGPHALTPPRLNVRSRLGEYLQSAEAAVLRDVASQRRDGKPRVFFVRPLHNPVGPFDFAGGFDDRSDRSQPLAELLSRGYEDAYRQFIEPVVGASGERVGSRKAR